MLVRAKVLAGYKVRIAGLADKLGVRCKTHAHLVKAKDIQDVVNLLTKFIEYLTSEIAALDSTRGEAIRRLQAHRRLARSIRSRCFTMMETYDISRGRAKPPEFYELLSELPRQLRNLARRLPDD